MIEIIKRIMNNIIGNQKNIIFLKIIAWLYIIIGMFAWVNIFISLFFRHFNFDLLGFVYFFIGIGLIKQKKIWRVFALVNIWVTIIGIIILIGFIIFKGNTIYISFLSSPKVYFSWLFSLLTTIFILIIFILQYIVLTRENIKFLFNKNKGKPPALPGDSQSLTIPGL